MDIRARFDKKVVNAVTTLVAAAAAWPSVLCFITDAMATPLERATRSAWCGAGPQAAEFLGHCAACWTGSAAFLAAAALIVAAQRRPAPQRIALKA